MTSEPLLQDSTQVYKNHWLSVREDRFRRIDTMVVYTIIDRAHSVIIIPLSSNGATLLVNQYRYPTRQYSWELPMGGIDLDESPESAAHRELWEETQLVAHELVPIGHYYAVPGLTPQEVWVFVAYVDDQALTDIRVSADQDEIWRAMVVPLADVDRMVVEGAITDGFTLAGLLYLKHFLVQRCASQAG